MSAMDWQLVSVVAEGLWWAIPLIGGIVVLIGAAWERRPWRKTYTDHARDYERTIRRQVESAALAEMEKAGEIHWRRGGR